jgi:tetratricopeptide (TPR) repeat protein
MWSSHMKVSAPARRFRVAALAWLCLGFVGATGPGCKGKPKPVAERQRKEAEHQVAEATFALNMKDWARAEPLLAKAAKIDPNNGVYWQTLGSTRMRLGNKGGAKEAYQNALKAYELEAASGDARKNPDSWLKQVQVLALLGRTKDARAKLDAMGRQFSDNRNVRAFLESKQFDRMIEDPAFKQDAL